VRDFDWSEFVGEGVVAVEWGEGEICDVEVEIEISGETERKVRIRFRR